MFLQKLIILIFISSASLTFADSPPSCMSEVKKLCPDQNMGAGMAKCAQKKQAEFSAPCQEKIKELKELVESAKKVCRADVKQACKGTKPGEGRIVECVLAHQSELSAPCRAKFTAGFSLIGESP